MSARDLSVNYPRIGSRLTVLELRERARILELDSSVVAIGGLLQPLIEDHSLDDPCQEIVLERGTFRLLSYSDLPHET